MFKFTFVQLCCMYGYFGICTLRATETGVNRMCTHAWPIKLILILWFWKGTVKYNQSEWLHQWVTRVFLPKRQKEKPSVPLCCCNECCTHHASHYCKGTSNYFWFFALALFWSGDSVIFWDLAITVFELELLFQKLWRKLHYPKTTSVP